jgi:protein-tyrosine-phosphatase
LVNVRDPNTNAREAPLLLFVCIGNICRSPMAEAILADEARRTGVRVRVVSAGTGALTGHPASESARAVLQEIGLDLGAHRARPVTRELVDEAALCVTATTRQRDDLRYFFPGDETKIVSFDDLTGLGELSDPYGGESEEFRKIRDLLREGAPKVLAALSR